MSNSSESKLRQYSVTISPVFHNKLDKHLFYLKKILRLKETKEKWLTKAIEEKLSREATTKTIENSKRICFNIDFMTKKKLEERIKEISRFCLSYSKKRWIIDAIQEKLDRDEEVFNIKFNELCNNITDNHN